MPKTPVEMSAAWRLRFNRELTNEVLGRARGYAEKLTFRYLQGEGITDHRYAHDIVNQAVLDTLQGIRTWDPDREPPPGGIPLFRHLCRVVYSRAYHERQRRKRQRGVAFHSLDIDSEHSVDNVIEGKMSLKRDDERQRPESRVLLRDLREKLYGPMRMHAAGDPEVLAYIGCLEEGITDEPSIRERGGWDENAFNRIRRRYLTAIKKIPESVLFDAKQVISRSPLHTGQDWRKAKGTEIGAKNVADEEDDDAALYGDDDDHDDDESAAAESQGDAEAGAHDDA